MQGTALILFCLVGVGPHEYSRPLDAKALDQATLDAEGYGEKKAFKREDDGLRITLAPGEAETGWKTPQTVRFGGNFKITASFRIKTLPKPAQEDGAAFGVAIAFQDVNHPDITLLRMREPNGTEIFRTVEKPGGNPMQPQPFQMMMMGGFGQPGGKPPKPPRPTFPASGDDVKVELQREGTTLRYQVLDAKSNRLRYLGQATLQPQDVAAIKLFVANRNGAEPVNVLLRDVSIQADRINGLGTIVRTVFGRLVYADPTSIDKDMLIIGGEPKAPPTPPASAPNAKPAGTPGNPPKPDAGTKPENAEKPKEAPKVEAVPAPAPAPAAVVVAVAVPQPGVAGIVVAAPVAPAAAAPPAATPAPAQANPTPGGAPNAQAGAPAQPPKPKEPKAKIPLDELESIQFERTPNLTARFVGQPNLDFTMPGLSAKKDDAKSTPGDKKDEPAKGGAKATKEPEKKDVEKPEKKDAEKAEKKDTKEPEKKDAEKAEKKDAKEPEKKDSEKAEKKDVEKPEKKDAEKAEKKDAADAKAEPVAKKAEAKPKKEADKAGDAEKKPGAADDPLAPPPGTAAVAKIPKLLPKKNGIRDINLSLGNLRPVAIKQITITCQTDGGPTSYRLDTTDSQDWPIVLRRSGTEGWADVFLEPPASDCHQKDFMVNVIYEDGQNGNVNAKAEGHSNAKLAIDGKAPQTAPLDAWVALSDDEKLFGKIDGMTEETLKLTTPSQEHINIPLGRVVGIHFCLLDRKETPASFAKRLKSRGTEDVLLAQTKNGEVVAISGVVEKLENERLYILYQGKSRSLPIKQVEGLVMATKPETHTSSEPRPTFTLPGGVAISGKWKDLDTSTWKVETAWGQELKLPAGDIQEVKFRGGKVTYLSDLTPGKVEETPFFGRKFGWRKDVNLLGEPLKVDGQTYDRGLAVHSRCELTYDLNGQYSSFETTLGFDDAAKGKGRVECRILADGKELYANPDLRADAPPVKLALPVKGAAELKLLVDFGRSQDTGDRVIWANARLVRPTPSEPSATKSAAKADSTKTPENVTERR